MSKYKLTARATRKHTCCGEADIDVDHRHGKAFGYFIEDQGQGLALAADVSQDSYDACATAEKRYKPYSAVYLAHLHVVRGHRRRGLGTALLERFINKAIKMKAQIVLLYANPEDMADYDDLHRFYSRHGFISPIASKLSYMELILDPFLLEL